MKKRKVIYTGLFLDETSRLDLIRAMQREVGQLSDNLKAHHLTLKFKPTDEDVDNLPIGSVVTFYAIGYGSDEKAQAALCTLPDGLASNNANPHVTVAVANGVSPVYSNDLLKNGATPFKSPVQLTARVGYFDGSKDVFEL